MANIGRVIAIVVFIIVILVELFVLNGYSYIYLGTSQIRSIMSNQPSFKYYISTDRVIVCVENNQNFTIFIYNISGKYIYLPQIEKIPSFSIKNISLVITNASAFSQAINSGNCVLSIKIGFLDANVTTTQVI